MKHSDGQVSDRTAEKTDKLSFANTPHNQSKIMVIESLYSNPKRLVAPPTVFGLLL